MSNLVDTFIMIPKEEEGINLKKVVLEDRRDYNNMFHLIVRKMKIVCLNQFFERDNIESICNLLEEEGYSSRQFIARWREDCLLQYLRRRFFKTILIVENDYDPEKLNRFIIVTGDVISEEAWGSNLPEAQKFSNLCIDSLKKDGFEVYNLDGTKVIKNREENKN